MTIDEITEAVAESVINGDIELDDIDNIIEFMMSESEDDISGDIDKIANINIDEDASNTRPVFRSISSKGLVRNDSTAVVRDFVHMIMRYDDSELENLLKKNPSSYGQLKHSCDKLSTADLSNDERNRFITKLDKAYAVACSA